MRLPGGNAPRSSSVRNISGASVSCSTQLTTMSCSARNAASGTRAVVGDDVAEARGRRRRGRTARSAPSGSASATAVDAAVGEDVDVVDADARSARSPRLGRSRRSR